MSENIINNTPYRTNFISFDSERRSRYGGNYISPADLITSYDRAWNFTGANVQRFLHVDLSGHTTQSNPLEIVTNTFANGVKLKAQLIQIPSYETDTTFTIQIRANFYDENDQIIRPIENMGINWSTITLYKNGQDSSDFDMLWTPYSYEWNSTESILNGDYATGFRTVGTYIFYRAINETHLPSMAPPLDQIIDNVVFDQFYAAASFVIHTDDDMELWKNGIQGGGDDTPAFATDPKDDTSKPSEYNPDYNPFSDPVDFPGLPTSGSALASGFIRVYSPTSGQLQALARKLWSSSFFNTIEKIMNDPMEAMISLHSIPFQIVGGPNANIEVGNYDTEISAKTVTTQYYTLDCGNISLPEHWASALDYSPYTTVDIFMPFVGVRPLQIDDVMSKVLNLKYNIDILTGSAIAMLKCGDSVLYTYNTQISTEIPYTMSSYGRLVQSIIGVAGTAIGAAAGGAGAIIGGSIGGALGTAMTKHSDISRGGALGGAVGIMGDFTPYLIIHRPIQSLAGDFAGKKGYPSNISATLGSVSGYTVVDKVHLTGIDCTDSERDEIHALLKDGVII